MDIQSIIKSVISLAEVVIKNPSTSVQNSGVDLSSLIKVAGSLLGGQGQQGAASGGLGSILGGIATSGALGSILGGVLGNKGQEQQPQQQSQGGGLGDLLGGILGGALQKDQPQAQQQSQGGGLGDLLGGLLGGSLQKDQPQEQASSSGDLLGQLVSKAGIIKDMLGGNQGQNLNTEQKTNLTDVLNIINLTKGFMGNK